MWQIPKLLPDFIFNDQYLWFLNILRNHVIAWIQVLETLDNYCVSNFPWLQRSNKVDLLVIWFLPKLWTWQGVLLDHGPKFPCKHKSVQLSFSRLIFKDSIEDRVGEFGVEWPIDEEKKEIFFFFIFNNKSINYHCTLTKVEKGSF